MEDPEPWSVDEVTAAGVLAALGLEPTAPRLGLVASQIARHRLNACEWAAERVHGAIIERLERAYIEQFGHHDMQWTDGFRAAEHEVMTARPAELLDLDRPGRSKGQMLRALVRQARRDDTPLVIRTPA